MLTAKSTELSEPVSDLPKHFTFSETAIDVISSASHSWSDCLNLLVEHKCYSDAIMLLALKLPLEHGIALSNWSIKNLSGQNITDEYLQKIVAEQDSAVNDSQSEPVNREANQPVVWLAAANFWNDQFITSQENYLEQLAKEAVYSSLALITHQELNNPAVYMRIINKGLSLFQQ